VVEGNLEMLMQICRRFVPQFILNSYYILPKRDRPKLLVLVILQAGIGFIDLLGVAAMGVLGALAVTGIQSQMPGDRVSQVLDLIGISEFSFQGQVAFLGLLAGVILVTRTVVSVFITRKALFFLSRRSAMITSMLVSRLLSQSLVTIQSKSTLVYSQALTSGVSSVTLGILGSVISVVADVSLLIIMLASLFVVDPLIALTSVSFFGLLGFTLYKLLNVRAYKLGYSNTKLTVATNEIITEVLETYREAVVRNRRDYYARHIGELSRSQSDVVAEMQFMPNITKYVIEAGMVVGAILIAGVQFAMQDAQHAVATLSVFMAASTRIAPAIMRLQQSLMKIKNSLGSAAPTIDLIKLLSHLEPVQHTNDELDSVHASFKPEIEVNSVSLTYPNQSKAAVKNITLKIRSGESVAIVGPSGAGKTSLIDLILGVQPPDSGVVLISGKNPEEAVALWPGAIAYVPQEIRISNSTFRENVSLGFSQESDNDDLIWEAIEIAQLTEFVKNLPLGLSTQVGNRGTALSGGQRQRLGIARALFPKPKLLVLDEATSSLDGQTESAISKAINRMKGSVTLLIIAHRLSTVRNVDKVIYLDDGKIVFQGTFEQVRDAVPNFDIQAKLMGL
jgi:ABC-type multidrug transport system fused ATPase/permease subunit